MHILIIGSGGREHALAWKIRQSPRCERLYCAPGNPGIATLAELALAALVDAGPAGDFAPLIAFCREHEIGLVVVGPERPLAAGIVDALAAAGIKAFGPTRAGAQLEASKVFAKQLMAEAGVPTGAARTFTALEPALTYLHEVGAPIVIKASGLAEGKGVTVARTLAEAEAALRDCLSGSAFGEAGREVLIEEFLDGEEASLLAFCDGTTIRVMDSAQDHKPVYDGDEGPNTGGMGAYSPAPVVTPALRERCVLEVFEPTLAALRAHGIDYRGVIYAGLIMCGPQRDIPKVIEFNARFGDPETQALLPRLENDVVDVMLACCEGRLHELELRWTPAACVCVVLASGGYPGPYAKGKVIHGLDSFPANGDVMLFHAGTGRDAAGQVVTAGGRVLGLVVRDTYLRVAIERAYELLPRVTFEGVHARTDIGRRALERME